MHRPIQFFACAGVLMAFVSCSTPKQIGTRSDLRAHDGKLIVGTAGGDRYHLSDYAMTDSGLFCSGQVTGPSGSHAFGGFLRFDSLTYILGTSSLQFFDYAVLIPTTITVGFIAMSYVGKDAHASAFEYTPGSGGGSCPLVLSWSGTSWTLEGEAVGTALGKGLETESGTVLRGIAGDGELRFALANDRPETHYIDRMRLAAVVHDPDATVLLDRDHAPWSVARPVLAQLARDDRGNDATAPLRTVDDAFWPDASVPRTDPYRDELELEFRLPEGVRTAAISVRARNTAFGGFALQYLYRLLGDETPDFIAATDVDPGLSSLLGEWLDRASLHVSVDRGGWWEKTGTIEPEAVDVPFERIVPIRLTGDGQGTLRVRLSMIAAGWMLDRVQLFTQAERAVEVQNVPIRIDRHPRVAAAPERLARADGSYGILIPGDTVTASAAPVAALPGRNTAYILYTRGYLHEWPVTATDRFRPVRSDLRATPRLDAVKMLLRKPEVLLPAIYKEWEKEQERMPR